MKNTKKFKIYQELQKAKAQLNAEFSYELNTLFRSARGLGGKCKEWSMSDEWGRRFAYLRFRAGKPERVVLDKKY